MSDLQRLINLSVSDPGFYVVALSAYIERVLDRTGHHDEHGYLSFADKLYHLKQQILRQNRGFIPELQAFGRIKHDRALTNGVRHNFNPLNQQEALAATHNFIQFCRVTDSFTDEELKSLQKTLERWDRRLDLDEELEKVKNLEWKEFQARRENTRLMQELEELHHLEEEKSELEEDLKLTNANLAALAKKGLLSEEKNKSLREERQALTLRLREAESRLTELSALQGYTEDLKRIVSYTRTRRDYESSLIRLSSEQKEVLTRIPEHGDFLITGPAGTGKSFILMEVLRRDLAERKGSLLDEGALILLSYTRTLVKYNSYIQTILRLDTRPDDRISTADSFLSALLKEHCPGFRIDYGILKTLITEIELPSCLSAKELQAELEDFIYAGACSRKAYIDDMVSRRGRKTALSRAQREEVWQAKTEIERAMEERKVLSKGYACARLLEADIPASYDRIYIDEVQDLSAAELRLYKSLTWNGLILAGDKGQSIYSQKPSYKQSGIRVQGYSAVLKTNFRSTRPIMKLTAPLRSRKEEIAAFRDGPEPELFTAERTEELYGLLEKRIRFLIDVLDYDPENIFILYPNRQFEKKINETIKRAGQKGVSISEQSFDFSEEGSIRISTLHSSKGLDMPVVLLFLPRLSLSLQLDEESMEQMKRNLLYVSLTRTMDFLNVFMKDEPEDKVLEELKEAFGGE